MMDTYDLLGPRTAGVGDIVSDVQGLFALTQAQSTPGGVQGYFADVYQQFSDLPDVVRELQGQIARVQNVLVALKVLLLAGFVAVGVFFGSLSWPTWVAATPTQTPVAEVLGSLFFIADRKSEDHSSARRSCATLDPNASAMRFDYSSRDSETHSCAGGLALH